MFALIVSAHPYCARKFTCHVMHLDYEQSLFFLSPSNKTRENTHARDWRRETKKLPSKALIAIFCDLRPLWPSSLTKPDLVRFRCSSGHVLSKTKSVTPQFFYISDITNSSSFNGRIFRKKINVRKFSRKFTSWIDFTLSNAREWKG